MEGAVVDALIIGGGPAGLSSALTLARQARSSVVFDSGSYRNDATENMHMLLGFDHASPSDFRAAARDNIASRYDFVTFKDANVQSVKKLDNNLFEVTTEGQQESWRGRKLILATGVEDIMLDIEGYSECWGKSIFHCLFCKGFEERNCESAAVLVAGSLTNSAMALHVARQVLALTKAVTFYTNGSEDKVEELTASFAGTTAMKIDTRRIQRFTMGTDNSAIVIHFEDGSQVLEGFLAHAPQTKVRGPFVEQLGIETSPNGDIKVNTPFCQTSIPGVFAVGDNSAMLKSVPNAIFTGTLAGTGAASQIMAEQLGQKSLFP